MVSPRPPDAGHSKILVVDDEQSILDIVKAFLEKEGYQVITALQGEAALKSARVYKTDLLILDIMLPGIDDVEVLTRLRRESDICVNMLTAKAEETDKIIGLSVGVGGASPNRSDRVSLSAASKPRCAD
ncbi:MAG: response regulator [Anaerolineales bacterium]|nr:response regulator [Anaerolineales bacterium]